ncbi:MAG: tRNA (cytidine(34)-2'-O)-methyltransferase [Thermodesulfobacteriota bacterium]
MHLVLYTPEIPPNTGNVARLCAATRTPLHLIEPLGFSLEDRYLRRAGLDYWPHVDKSVWPDFASYLAAHPERRIVLASARQGERYDRFAYTSADTLVLGPETRGLPEEILSAHPHCVRLPIWGQVRSLNLSTAAGILLYEALRQSGGFPEE